MRQTSSKGLTTAKTYAAVSRKLSGTHHFHTCVEPLCRSVYVCTCKTPAVNGRCRACRFPERIRPLWDSNRDRNSCCTPKELKQVTTSAETERYRLAGPGPWFRCAVCSRCHGRMKDT